MASLFVSTPSSSSLALHSCHNSPLRRCYSPISPKFGVNQSTRRRSPLRFSAEDDRVGESADEASSSPVAIAEEQKEDHDANNNAPPSSENSEEEDEKKSKQQEMDWKTDEEFKRFMGNPSIEAAIKLEKTRTDRKLKELNRESNSENPIIGIFNSLARDTLTREKERLEKAQETFKALDLNKVNELIKFFSNVLDCNRFETVCDLYNTIYSQRAVLVSIRSSQRTFVGLETEGSSLGT